jgi:hypothetical protein
VVRDNVGRLKKQGRSRDETVAAKPTSAFDAKLGNFVMDGITSPGESMRVYESECIPIRALNGSQGVAF